MSMSMLYLDMETLLPYLKLDDYSELVGVAEVLHQCTLQSFPDCRS
jgi:hypothetical protein